MTRLVALSLVAAALVAPQAPATQGGPPQQTPVFRSTADVVPLFVTVTNKAGRLVTDLTREDFQVLDGGKPQPLTLFDNSMQPIRLIMMIDLSYSVAQNLPLFRQAFIQLIKYLTPGDLVRIGTFGHEITFSPTFTLDAQALAAFLPTRIEENTPTPLWTAVDQAIGEFATAPPGRRVILILSDGKDGPGFNQKFTASTDVSKRAQQEDVMIYGIGVRSLVVPQGGGTQGMMAAMSGSFPDPSLGGVAEETGGGYFELRGYMNMPETFSRVADELHRQYLLGFSPPVRDGKTHKIEVKVRNGDMKPRVRKTYVAPKPK